ncbi:hypothetical protein NPIL_562861 [Nephila pilipes]|uniref:Uncharacterized protein n=1 Tax=Nephila pilipes TaxID=299642 RepID=A0A8X6QS91_NEPPI|nr:hypothetical protein NPIL_562861 [Nephila pilipes]
MIFEIQKSLLSLENVLNNSGITREVITNLSSQYKEKIPIAAQDVALCSELNIKKLVAENHQRFLDLHCRNNCAFRQQIENDLCENLLLCHFYDALNNSLFRFENMASGRNQPAKASGGDGKLHSAAKNSHLYQNSLPIAKKVTLETFRCRQARWPGSNPSRGWALRYQMRSNPFLPLAVICILRDTVMLKIERNQRDLCRVIGTLRTL